MVVPVPSISCCVFNNNDFFYQEPNELAFNRDTCCHLVICLQLIASHCLIFKVRCSISWQTLDKVASWHNGTPLRIQGVILQNFIKIIFTTFFTSVSQKPLAGLYSQKEN
jgi:hypothetical protein